MDLIKYPPAPRRCPGCPFIGKDCRIDPSLAADAYAMIAKRMAEKADFLCHGAVMHQRLTEAKAAATVA